MRRGVGLIQERLWNGDPWRVLVCCILLNRTQGVTAEPILKVLFKAWSTAADLANASPEVLHLLISPLGFGEKRTDYLLSMSAAWALTQIAGKDMTTVDPTKFKGCGTYAKETWDMIVLGKHDFVPNDVELKRRMREFNNADNRRR
jgi:endonuclease III